MKNKILYTLVFAIALFSCKKAGDRSCWKGSGDTESLTIALGDFHTLVVKPKVQVTLVPDTVNYLEIDGFENLNNQLTYEIVNGELTLVNSNKCDFLRSYKKKAIPVKVHFREMDFLDFHGTEPLYTQGVITGNKFDFQCIDGAGTVHLNVDVTNFSAVQGNGFGNYIVSGQCVSAKHILANNGYCDALNLSVSENLNVVNRSQADGKFNISNTQNVRLQTIAAGDIQYRGTAVNLEKSELSTGRIYQIN